LQAKNNKYLKSVHVEFTEKKLQYLLFLDLGTRSYWLKKYLYKNGITGLVIAL
jgi:hypothetical protein